MWSFTGARWYDVNQDCCDNPSVTPASSMGTYRDPRWWDRHSRCCYGLLWEVGREQQYGNDGLMISKRLGAPEQAMRRMVLNQGHELPEWMSLQAKNGLRGTPRVVWGGKWDVKMFLMFHSVPSWLSCCERFALGFTPYSIPCFLIFLNIGLAFFEDKLLGQSHMSNKAWYKI